MTTARAPARAHRPHGRRPGARLRSALRAHWPYFAATVALAAAGAIAYVTLAEKRYEARAEVYVAASAPSELADLPALRAGTSGRSAEVAARQAVSPPVIARVRSRLDIAGSRGTVADLVQVRVLGGDIVRITGVAGTPEAAAELANAFAGGLIAERTRRFQLQLRQAIQRTTARLAALGEDAAGAEAASLAGRLADYRALTGSGDPTIEIIQTAEPPRSPAWPRPATILAAALLLALVLGAAVVLVLEARNPTIVTEQALADPSGPRVLALLPRPTHEEARALLLAPGAVADDLPEPLRHLSESIATILPNGSGPRAFLVTSPDSREGAAMVAATVAALMADAGVPVALLDVDFERAPVKTILNGNGKEAPSVGQILASGDWRYLHHLHRVDSGAHRLRLLLADPADRRLGVTAHAVEALASELKSRVSALVISTPPLPAKETAALLDLADEVIVVIALGHTRRDRLADLRRTLALRRIQPYGYVALEE